MTICHNDGSPRGHERMVMVQSLRHQARIELETIAGQSGFDSTLLGRCREAWNAWERQAIISILYDDYANAEVILDRGVHALRQVLPMVGTDRLSAEEVAQLIAAA
jgi:hypothetical protein